MNSHVITGYQPSDFSLSLHGTDFNTHITTKQQQAEQSETTSMNLSPSPFDDESLAALSNASQVAGIEAEQTGFIGLESNTVYSSFPEASTSPSMMQRSVSSNELSQKEAQRHGKASPSSYYGRTRSLTARHTLAISSAPPHLGEDSADAEGTSWQGSPENTSVYMNSMSGSDLASEQNSPGNVGADTTDTWTPTTAESSVIGKPPLGSAPLAQQHPLRKKRNKCSPEQYRQLEAFFAKNRNPTGKVREELSKRIQMPERSVQVWFQNKRAKTKINEIKEGIPPEQRTTVARPKVQRSASNSAEYKRRKAAPPQQQQQSSSNSSAPEDSVIQLPATSLCVGEWRRIKPLICLFSRRNQCFTWFLSSESVGFKLESPRACVRRVVFAGPRHPTIHEFGEGIHSPLGHLIIDLERPPQFYMEVFRSSGKDDEGSGGVQKASWRQCSDFTEGKQATTVLTHVVCGPYALLRHAVLQLQQTGSHIGQLIEFQDGAAVPAEQSNWSPPSAGLLDPHAHEAMHYAPGYSGVSEHRANLSMSTPATTLDVAGASGYFGGQNTTAAWSTPSSSSPWVTDFGAHQQDIGSVRSAATGHVSYPATPHSASSALDMSALRIDSASLSSSHLDAAVSAPAVHRGLPASSASSSHPQFAVPQWPQTASHTSMAWNVPASAQATVQMSSAFDPMHGSGAASAPPYQARGFEQQQERAHPPPPPPPQHTDASLADHSYFSGSSNPMSGVGCGPVASAGPGFAASSNFFAQEGYQPAGEAEEADRSGGASSAQHQQHL